jgi:hypothetical protein
MELVGGSITFLAVTVIYLVGVMLTLYTRRGSGINQHPYRHVHGGAPAAALPCEDFSGSDRTSVHEREVHIRWARAAENSAAAREAALKRSREERARSRPRRADMSISSPLPPMG